MKASLSRAAGDEGPCERLLRKIGALMTDPNDFVARHTQKYNFSEEELGEFLAQSVPRDVPDALKHREGHSVGVIVATGVPVCLGLILGPLYFRNAIGNGALILAGMGLALSLGAIVAALKWDRDRPSLLCHGQLAAATFSSIESPRGRTSAKRCQ